MTVFCRKMSPFTKTLVKLFNFLIKIFKDGTKYVKRYTVFILYEVNLQYFHKFSVDY